MVVLGRVFGPVDGLALLGVDGVALGLVDSQVHRLTEDVLADVVPTERGETATSGGLSIGDDDAGDSGNEEECRLY